MNSCKTLFECRISIRLSISFGCGHHRFWTKTVFWRTPNMESRFLFRVCGNQTHWYRLIVKFAYSKYCVSYCLIPVMGLAMEIFNERPCCTFVSDQFIFLWQYFGVSEESEWVRVKQSFLFIWLRERETETTKYEAKRFHILLSHLFICPNREIPRL